VIYVMGAGRSGSTVLGIALGNCADVLYAGEVEEWLVCSGAPGLGGAERTRFWSAVREEVDVAGAAGLFGAAANRYVERSSALLRVDRWPARARMLAGYRSVAEDLFRSIARTAGVANIVDTSHFPLRARELQKLTEVELYLVYLVRDPQDVVASNLRELRRHEVAERRVRILTMNANLWFTQLVSLLVFLRQPPEKRIFVRHEEFIADPESVLREILDGLGISAAVPDLASLQVGVPFQGNRLINSEAIALKRSTRPVVRWSRFTAVLQMCWSPVLARLKPAARAGASRVGHASPDEPRQSR